MCEFCEKLAPMLTMKPYLQVLVVTISDQSDLLEVDWSNKIDITFQRN